MRTTLRGLSAGASALALGLALVGAAPASRGAAAPADVVAALAGSWGGGGRISYTDGSSESIRCSAHYGGSGRELRMAIQCRSEHNPINIRSRLRLDGRHASGDWEERTFNASGTASGSVGPGTMHLNVSGGGFTGTMRVSYGRGSHTVTISTQGVSLSRVTMHFSRR